MSLIKKLSDSPSGSAETHAAADAQTAHRIPHVVGKFGDLEVLVQHVQERLMRELAGSIKVRDPVYMRATIDEVLNCILAEEGLHLPRKERDLAFEYVVAEVIGLGPLEPLLSDSSTTDIMVVGPDLVYVERKGKILRTSVRFRDSEHLKRVIDRIMAPLGRRVDESSPTVDARLPDGSRVNVVVPPVALDGAALTIRKFSVIPLTVDDLIEFNTATPAVFEFLRGAVIAGLNVIVSGGSSSGKTTLLNVLSGFIPQNERIVTIENAAELQLQQPHVVRLESRPANVEDQGEITMRDLVINALRMRPDRIVVGEVRSAEAIDLLQAMNTGHDGSMGTLHANSTRDALSRLETMVLSAGMDLPVRAIREQMASAINIIIHMGRSRDGSRRILSISEVDGIEVDSVRLSDIFRYEHDTGRPDAGELVATGLTPRCMGRLQDTEIYLPPQIFMPPPWMSAGRVRAVESSGSSRGQKAEGGEAARPRSEPAAKPAKPEVEPEAAPINETVDMELPYDSLAETVQDQQVALHPWMDCDDVSEEPQEPAPKAGGLLSRLSSKTDVQIEIDGPGEQE